MVQRHCMTNKYTSVWNILLIIQYCAHDILYVPHLLIHSGWKGLKATFLWYLCPSQIHGSAVDSVNPFQKHDQNWSNNLSNVGTSSYLLIFLFECLLPGTSYWRHRNEDFAQCHMPSSGHQHDSMEKTVLLVYKSGMFRAIMSNQDVSRNEWHHAQKQQGGCQSPQPSSAQYNLQENIPQMMIIPESMSKKWSPRAWVSNMFNNFNIFNRLDLVYRCNDEQLWNINPIFLGINTQSTIFHCLGAWFRCPCLFFQKPGSGCFINATSGGDLGASLFVMTMDNCNDDRTFEILLVLMGRITCTSHNHISHCWIHSVLHCNCSVIGKIMSLISITFHHHMSLATWFWLPISPPTPYVRDNCSPTPMK